MQTNLSDVQIAEYQKNGVIHIKNAIDQPWVERMLKVVEKQIANPSSWANNAKKGNTNENHLFTDRYQWKHNSEINAFIHKTNLGKLAAQAMNSKTARFYFDHILVKEPKTTAETPWHQDVPYWPFKGKQICSIWVALTEATIAESAMEFVAGSHLDGNYYMPEAFVKETDNKNAKWQQEGQGTSVPPIEEQRGQHNIVGWDVKPSDALLFSAWTLHWAPGNSSSTRRRAAISTRWLGDDAIWFPHEGADPTVQQKDVAIQPGEHPIDDEIFPCIWSEESYSA